MTPDELASVCSEYLTACEAGQTDDPQTACACDQTIAACETILPTEVLIALNEAIQFFTGREQVRPGRGGS